MFDETLTNEIFNHTTVHPIGLLVVLLLAGATCVVPRRFVLVPLLVLACCVASAQRIVIASFDFDFLRILILVGWARVLLRRETKGFTWKRLDTMVLCWVVVAAVVASALHATAESVVYQLGLLYTAIGIYFLARIAVRDWDDLHAFARCTAWIAIPVAGAFLIEASTARNMFAVFGGVPEVTEIRADRLRCQGPFSHPILAGCFWASLMPIMAALFWSRGGDRPLAVAGLLGALVVVVTCASATPISGVFAGLVAGSLFIFRRRMSWVQWGCIGTLVALHLVMNKPVWHLISRVDLVSGSAAWYRYEVLDAFIRNFPEWALMGTLNYVTWWEWGLDDITNQYVAHGIEGGLLSLMLFLGIILVAFRAVGKTWRRASQQRYQLVTDAGSDDATNELPAVAVVSRRARVAMAWALGVSLFIHCIVFFGVTYFGQAILVWYLSLAFIGSLAPTPAMKVQIRSDAAEEPQSSALPSLTKSKPAPSRPSLA